MTTTDDFEIRGDELARKIARVHGLRDPLGAKGQRKTRDRIDRETRARRALFAAALASFAICFGAVTVTEDKPADAANSPSPPTFADIPLNDGQGTIVRILKPPPSQTPQPHVRTRATR